MLAVYQAGRCEHTRIVQSVRLRDWTPLTRGAARSPRRSRKPSRRDHFHHVREYGIKELEGVLWVSVGEELRRLRRQAGPSIVRVSERAVLGGWTERRRCGTRMTA